MSPWYAWCRSMAQMIFIFVFRGRVFGRGHIPRTGGVLLLSNHQSFFDPILAAMPVPRACSFMARDSLFRQPLFKWLISGLNAFPVKRGTADMGAIRETMRRLKSGRIVLAFPEGTRTRDGSVGDMLAGMVLLARKTGVPIVPTLIEGAFESWPRSAKLPRPRPIVVAYAEPLYAHLRGELSDRACAELVRDKIVEMQARFREHTILRG